MHSLRKSQMRMCRRILSRHHPHEGAGVEIYRTAYTARLVGTLRRNYPVVERELGEGSFGEVAAKYVRSHGSTHYSLRWYGAHLWQMLDGPLADLARMEWAVGVAFDAKDAPPLTFEAISGERVDAWPALSIAMHPATQVLDLTWSAEDLWERSAPPRVHAHGLIVWRKELQPRWRATTIAEARALRRLQRQHTLRDACEDVPDELAARMGEWFAGWVNEGLLVLREPA
jgi:hypothetical protein